MSRIRTADIPDIDALCELGRELQRESVYAELKADEQKFRMTLAGLMGHKRGIVLLVVDDMDCPQGFLAGIVDEYGFSQSRFGTDLWTYVRKSHRGYAASLYKRFIKWAAAKPKVAFIEFGQSSGVGYNRWCALMERLGLFRNGSFYIKKVKNEH